MREMKLVSWEDFPNHLNNIKKSLESIYETYLTAVPEEISFADLYPTEEFLEKDKLTLVLMKRLSEGYDVPIIAAKRVKDYFILDGHHRSFILKKMMEKEVRSWVLIFPESRNYRVQPRRLLENLPIRDVMPIDNPVLKAWSQILTLLKYYEALYDVSFNLIKIEIPLGDLVPTQPQILRAQISLINELLVPIVCVEFQKRFYILDGHARSVRAKQLGLDSIRAIVLSPVSQLSFGIVRTSRELNLTSLDDVKIVE